MYLVTMSECHMVANLMDLFVYVNYIHNLIKKYEYYIFFGDFFSQLIGSTNHN